MEEFMNKFFAGMIIFFIICAETESAPLLKISEVFFKSTTTTVENYVEIYCLDDGNGGNGINIGDYALLYFNTEWKTRSLGDFDNDISTPNAEIIIKSNGFHIISVPDFLKTSNSILLLSSAADYNNKIDCVVWDDGYYTTQAVLTELTALKNQGFWSSDKRNGIVLPQPLERRVSGTVSYPTHSAISRYFAAGKLSDNADSYLNWFITTELNQNRIPSISGFSGLQVNATGLTDLPNDKGGNLKVSFEKCLSPEFYSYNIYICSQALNLRETSLKPVIVKTNRDDNEAVIGVNDIQDKSEYTLLDNNVNYYVLVTVSDIYGREQKNKFFSIYAKPAINNFAIPNLRITELFPEGYSDLGDMIEIYCVDDGNGGAGSNIGGYSVSDYSPVNSILSSKSEYKGNIKVFEDLLIRTGDFCVIECGKNNIDDKQGYSGKIKTYSLDGAIAEDDIIVLYSPSGDALDCAAYTNDYEISSTKTAALGSVYNYGCWNSNSATNMIYTGKIKKSSIVRNNKLDDTNSKNDWKVSTAVSVNSDNTPANQTYANLEFQNRVFMVDGSDLSRSSVNISFDINILTVINVRIYDVQGRLIKKVKESELIEIPGRYTVSWDGKNSKNKTVPTGIYIVLLDFFSGAERIHKSVKQTVVAARKM